VAPWRTAARAGELARAAAAVGYPVVLKAYGDTLVHKSDVGAVRTGLADEAALGAAAAEMAARLAQTGVEPAGFLVQKQVVGGREAILGIVRDPAVGPLVMAGLGGVAAEVWKDVAFRVAPLACGDARAMLAELRGAPLLGAFRGARPADTEALVDAIVRLAALAAACPEIAECDVNPLFVMDEGGGCVAVDARVRISGE
jgi:acetyltransferase